MSEPTREPVNAEVWTKLITDETRDLVARLRHMLGEELELVVVVHSLARPQMISVSAGALNVTPNVEEMLLNGLVHTTLAKRHVEIRDAALPGKPH